VYNCCRVLNWERLFTYLLTLSMEQSHSWKANRFSALQEIPRILWNLKVQYRVYKYPPPAPILSMYPFRNKTSFYGWELLVPRPTPKQEDHTLSASASAYSIYSHIPSILEAVPPFTTWGRTVPLWQGPTYRGPIANTLHVILNENTHEPQSVLKL